MDGRGGGERYEGGFTNPLMFMCGMKKEKQQQQ